MKNQLFHYTTQKGLYGIIESKSLWFTNILFLNDAAECGYTFQLMQDELEEKRMIHNHPIFNFMKDHSDFQHFLSIVKYIASYYVFSFSQKPDDLSQWRAYGDDGGGYCIEFDYDEILRIAKNNEWPMMPCLYEDEKQREEIIKFIDEQEHDYLNNPISCKLIETEYLGTKKTDLTDDEDKILTDIKLDFLGSILKFALKFKHPQFSEEEEFRILIVEGKSNGRPLKCREGRSTLIPYLDINIADSGDKMPIKQIIIGPTNHPLLSKIAIEDILQAHSIECKVELSKIPYRAKP